MKKTNHPMVRMKVCRHGLEPVSRIDAELLGEFRLGEEVECVIHAPKSLPELRLFWSVLGHILPNQSTFATTKDLANALLVEAGHFREVIVTLDGSLSILPASISEMGKAEFHEFFQKAKTIIGEHVIPGLDVDEMIEEMARERG